MTDTLFDESKEAHQTALRKLDSEIIGWLTTVRADGTPHSVPVWFLWHDGTVIVLSEPPTTKVRAIRRGSPVQFHLESGPFGSEIVILTGSAVLSDRPTTEWLDEIGAAYGTKYAEGMVDYGMDIGPIAEQFSTVIVMTPEKLAAW
ncbi:hypothetical protein E6C70_09140 [Glaciibacter flavus]|uniref:Pyridoxamine 5'-phosphate oxidase N-terminal domain-containing protein n=1 Tax=Orlajensenia flava TaxID=2565934 RepID=A0A4S4FWF0_9MICO|nr:pyridoxamine 5'-phosphate oxidase family protein [Glaciibacter flavus]THG34422.1 hypothetical protein E6C70_09140 [Glaciibacter flavus]